MSSLKDRLEGLNYTYLGKEWEYDPNRHIFPLSKDGEIPSEITDRFIITVPSQHPQYRLCIVSLDKFPSIELEVGESVLENANV